MYATCVTFHVMTTINISTVKTLFIRTPLNQSNTTLSSVPDVSFTEIKNTSKNRTLSPFPKSLNEDISPKKTSKLSLAV